MKLAVLSIWTSSVLVLAVMNEAHAQNQSADTGPGSSSSDSENSRRRRVQFDDYENQKFKAHELSFDFVGTLSFGQDTLENLSSDRVDDDERLGAGVGLNYFFTRGFGIGIDAYTENTRHSFVDNASISLLFRIPIEPIGLAPYGLVGVGRQLDPVHVDFLQAGAGLEWRFHKNVGIFTEARYMFLEQASDVGVGRLGLRIRF